MLHRELEAKGLGHEIEETGKESVLEVLARLLVMFVLGVLFNSSYSRRLRIIVVYGKVVGIRARLSVRSVYTREDSGDWDEREIPPKTFQRDLVALSGYYLGTRSIVCLLFNNTRYGLTLGLC